METMPQPVRGRWYPRRLRSAEAVSATASVGPPEPNVAEANTLANIAAVYKDMPDNGYCVPEAEVKAIC